MADEQMLEYRMDARPFPPMEIYVLFKRQVPRPPNGPHLAEHGYRRAPQLIEFDTHFRWHGPAFYFSASPEQRYFGTEALMNCGKTAWVPSLDDALEGQRIRTVGAIKGRFSLGGRGFSPGVKVPESMGFSP
jgi:hypothetical protein